MIDRNYILNIIKSKDVTIDQFNYDKMVAPPIHYYFNDIDLNRLYQIATSLRYAAKPQVKYQEIDNIMKSRGFRKLAAGTNRLVYACIENDSIACKIAYDAVGIGDNPREFINQNYLKPFCAKTFEVSSNGVLSFQERVNPITNREEFLSIAEDIFNLITEYIIGEYVMDDIGTKYFMNYGLRRGFGPVCLDYPYVYRLDGNKLFCNKPDPTNPPSLVCGGEIDYDAGYNNLICKKCGKIYRAHELELKIANKMIITGNDNKGEHKMKVTILGGSKGYNVTTSISNTNIDEPVNNSVWTSSDPNEKKKEIHVSLKDIINKEEIVKEVKTSNNKNNETKTEEVQKAVNGVPDIKQEESKKEVASIIEESPKVEEKKEEAHNLKSPVSFGNSKKKTPKELFRDSIYNSAKNIADVSLSNNLDKDYILEAIHNLNYLIDTLRSTSVWDHECEVKLHNIVIDGVHEIHDLKNEREDNKVIATSTIYSKIDDVNEEISSIEAIYEDEVQEEKEYDDTIDPAQEIESSVDEYYLPDEESSTNNENVDEEIVNEDEYYINDDATDNALVGIATFAAKTIDISTKFPNSHSKNVIVIEDSNGEFLTVGENGDHLLVIDRINGLDTSEAEVVSKSFISNVLKEVEDKATELPNNTNEEITTVNGVS